MNRMQKFWELIRLDDPEGGSGAADGSEAPVIENPPQEDPPAPTPAAPAPQMIPAEVMHRRVAALTRQKADLERELELARLGQQLDPAAPPTPPAPSRPNLMNEAQILAEQMRRNEKAQDVVNEGNAIAGDFMLRVNTMNQMLGQLPDTFLDAVMDVGENSKGAAELLYELSQDLQRAGNILGMSPTKMAVELTKFKNDRKPSPQPKPVPKAPPTPVSAPIGPKAQGGRSASVPGDLTDPNLGTDAWMKQRDEAARTSRRY